MALASDLDARERDHVKADIVELNQLIDEILLASRLDAVRTPERSEPIDLLALAAEEAARDGLSVEGQSVTISGERALLQTAHPQLDRQCPPPRRRRRARDPCRQARGSAVIEVRDHGVGIAADERDKIFEPFYRPQAPRRPARAAASALHWCARLRGTMAATLICKPADGGGSLFAVSLAGSNAALGRQRRPTVSTPSPPRFRYAAAGSHRPRARQRFRRHGRGRGSQP